MRRVSVLARTCPTKSGRSRSDNLGFPGIEQIPFVEQKKMEATTNKIEKNNFFDECMSDEDTWPQYYGMDELIPCDDARELLQTHSGLSPYLQQLGQNYRVHNIVLRVQTSAGQMMCMKCHKTHKVLIIQKIAVRYKGRGHGSLFVAGLITYAWKYFNIGVMLQSCLREGKLLANSKLLQMKPDTCSNYYGCALGRNGVTPDEDMTSDDVTHDYMTRKRPCHEQPNELSIAGVRTRSQTAAAELKPSGKRRLEPKALHARILKRHKPKTEVSDTTSAGRTLTKKQKN